MGQFGLLNQMQEELDETAASDEKSASLVIRIVGVNATGLEVGNPLATDGLTLPWLQDTAEVNAWGAWDVTWRDVIILDGENRQVAVFNLTANDLHVVANYDSLKQMLVNAAHPGESQ